MKKLKTLSRYFTFLIMLNLVIPVWSQQEITVDPQGNGDFTTIQAAFESLNGTTLSSDVVINIRTGNYDEELSLSDIESSESDHNILIRSDTDNPEDVIIRNSEMAVFTGRILTIQFSSNITFSGITFESGSADELYFVGLLKGSNNIKFINNKFLSTHRDDLVYGFFELPDYSGDTAACRNIEISDNEFYDVLPFYNLYLSYVNLSFNDNHIEILTPISKSGQSRWFNIDGLTISRNEFIDASLGVITNSSGVEIFRNKVISETGSIAIANNVEGEADFRIYNNFFTGENFGVGINTGGLVAEIVNNNFWIKGSTSESGIAFSAFSLTPGETQLKIYNNNFYGTGSDMAGVSIYTSEGSIDALDIESDHNNYYFPHENYWHIQFAENEYLDLSQLRSFHGFEENGMSMDPVYRGEYDLHAGNAGLKDKGMEISYITEDYDGDPRTGKPDIGADEIKGSIGLAPLEIKDITGNFQAGKNLQFRYRAENTGSLDLSSSWKDAIYLSTDSQFDPEDRKLEEISHEMFLASGDDYSGDVSISLPLDISGGTYYLLLKINDEDLEFDNNLSDNVIFSESLQIAPAVLPDLEVVNIVTPPTQFSGKSFELQWMVTNAGESITPGLWQDYIYVANDPEYLSDPGILESDSLLVRKVGAPVALNPGESYQQSYFVDIPLRYSGKIYYRIQSNANGAFIESDGSFTDNGLNSDVINISQSPLPDLVVSELNTPNTAFSGGKVPVNWTVKNLGQQRTYRTSIQLNEKNWLNRVNYNYWYDQVYISKKPYYDPDEETQRAVARYNRPAEELDPEQSYIVNDSIEFLACEYGLYYVFVRANADFYTYELDMQNNFSIIDSIELIIDPKPDLLPVDVSVINSPVSGGEISLTYKVLNDGFNEKGESRVMDYFFISALDSFNVDQSEMIGYASMQDSLLQGESYSGNLSLQLPYDIFGDVNLYLYTDYFDNICEVQGETNNILKRNMSITLSDQPDLVPEIEYFPDTLIAGRNYELDFSVYNQGEADAIQSSWFDKLILGNKDLYIEEEDDTLAHGSVYERTVRFFIPADMPEGDKKLELITDSEDQLFEYGFEDNNSLVKTVYIKHDLSSVADLELDILTIENESITGGDTLELAYTVSNNSVTTPVSGWHDRIRLKSSSGDIVWEKEVNHIGAIESGETYEGFHKVKIPYFVRGDYIIELSLNYRQGLVEYVLNNNTAEIPSTINPYSPPDVEVDFLNYSQCCNFYALQENEVILSLKNNGPGDLNEFPFTLEIELSEDQAGSNARTLITHRQEFTIKKGEVITLNLPVQFDPSFTGDYFSIVNLDTDREVYEGKAENNNHYVSGFTVNINNEPIHLAPIDLTINSDTEPEFDRLLSISYTVEKGTENSLQRNIEDQLILSTDRLYNGDDYRFMNPEPVYRNLTQGEYTYTGDLVAGIPNYLQPGWYFIGVKVDARNNILEHDETNNVFFTADSFYLDFTIPLQLDQAYSGSFYEGTVNGQEAYRIDRPEGKGMLVNLDFSNDQASTELYHRIGTMPTSSVFDTRFRDPFIADQELVVPVIDSSTTDYLRLIANRVPWVNNIAADFDCWADINKATGGNIISITDPSCTLPDEVPFTVLAESAEFSILRTYPDSASYLGVSNLLIEGFDFEDSIQFMFIQQTDTIKPQSISLLSSTEAVAIFDFRDQPGGKYDIVAVKENGESTRLNDSFTLFNGGPPAPWASVNHSVRTEVVNNKFYVNVDFGNYAYMNGYDYWLLVAVSNESGNLEYLETSYIGSSSEEFIDTLDFNYNPVNDSGFVDIDGIRYYAYWVPVLPPRSQTTFTYIFQSSVSEFILTQALLYEQPYSNFQLKQDLDFAGESITIGKLMDEIFSSSISPLTDLEGKKSGGFDCNNIDMNKVTKQITEDVKKVAQKAHAGAKTYKDVKSIDKLVEKALEEKKKEYIKKGKDAVDVKSNFEKASKKAFRKHVISMVKKEESTMESFKKRFKEVFNATDPKTQIEKAFEPEKIPFEDLINNTFKCIQPDDVTPDVKECYTILGRPGEYKVARIDNPGCPPPPGGGGGGSDGTDVVDSDDPNAIKGPEGTTDLRFINRQDKLKYIIQFENMPEATAPARFVSINNDLPAGLRPQTFVLKEFGFGDTIIQVEPTNRLNIRVPLGKKYNYMELDLVAGLDIVNNRAFWRFSTLDPETGNLTLDPFSGFLPPNDSTGIGEGFVSYEIYLEPDVEGGRVIENQADIIFDQNEIIPTNVWSNIVVSSSPLSEVGKLPVTSPEYFTINWTGNPGENSAGIRGFDIYISKDNGPFTLLYKNTLANSARFRGEHGSSYRFYSILNTLDGESEPMPEEADAETMVDTTMVSAEQFKLKNEEGELFAHIYPNPASGSVNIEFSSQERVDLVLFDLNGRVLTSRRLEASQGVQKVNIDLNPYENGILILKIGNKYERQVHRIVKY